MVLLANTPAEVTVLRLEARKSFSFGLHVCDTRGRPVDLTGCTLRFSRALVWPPPAGAPQLGPGDVLEVDGDVVAPALGYARIDLQASHLDSVPGTYPFSVVLTTAEGYSLLLLKGEVQLQPNTEFASLDATYPGDAPPKSLRVVLADRNVVRVTVGAVLPPNAGYITDADKAKLDLIQVTGDGITLDMGDVALRPEVVSRDDAVLAAAQEHASDYADGIGVSTLTAAQNYADGIGGSTLTAAQGYADGAAADTLSAANAYTDSQIDSHQHSAADIISGTLPIARGGTGATSAAAARAALGAAYAGHSGVLSDLDDWDQYPSGNSVAYFSDPAGAPSGLAYGTVVTHKAVSSRTFQFAYGANADALYVRYYYGGTWGAWREVGLAGRNGSPFRMAAGGINITFSNTPYSSASVTFPAGRFTATPIIVITQASLPAGAALLIPKFTGASPSGFTAYAYTGNATNTTVTNVQFHWIAVQMSATTGVG